METVEVDRADVMAQVRRLNEESDELNELAVQLASRGRTRSAQQLWADARHRRERAAALLKSLRQ